MATICDRLFILSLFADNCIKHRRLGIQIMFLLIDNYDSFTYNLVHYLGELGATTEVHRNDEITVDEVIAKAPQGIVISPGPCDPDKAGICLDLIKETDGNIPIFGVCLGFQAIGQAYGGDIIRAHPMHGKVSSLTHNNTGLFKNLASPFNATRYHSLIVDRDTLPDCLDVTCQSDDGLVMGLSHKTKPLHGVQFHPESIASEHGHKIIKNFLELA